MRARKQTDLPRHDEVIGETEVGGVKFTLFHGLGHTVGEVAKRSRRDLQQAYREITGATDLPAKHDLLLQVVQGAVQAAWYLASGREIPERCVANQEARIKAAKAASETRAIPPLPDGKLRRVRDIIEAGLLAGLETADILARVKDFHPNSKASHKDVAYYRYHLKKQGKLADA